LIIIQIDTSGRLQSWRNDVFSGDVQILKLRGERKERKTASKVTWREREDVKNSISRKRHQIDRERTAIE